MPPATTTTTTAIRHGTTTAGTGGGGWSTTTSTRGGCCRLVMRLMVVVSATIVPAFLNFRMSSRVVTASTSGGGGSNHHVDTNEIISAGLNSATTTSSSDYGALPYYSTTDPKGLSAFDSALHPVIRHRQPSIEQNNRPIIKARLFTGTKLKKLPTAKHILYDGMLHSDVIDFYSHSHVILPKVASHYKTAVEHWVHDDLWVIDYTHMHSIHFNCTLMEDIIRQTQRQRLEQQQQHANPLVILGIDLDDTPNVTHCANIPKMTTMNDQQQQQPSSSTSLISYRFAKRSLTHHRCWSLKDAFVFHGYLIPNINYGGGGPMLHMSFSVRSDTARVISRIVQEEQGDKNPVVADRRIDVSHYYTKARVGRNMYYHDKLRLWVDAEIKRLNETRLFEDDQNSAPYIKSHAGTIGAAMQTGRKGVTEDFVRHMLQTKIIVVSQRDSWEDHWRLFEALAAGALVMHDPMLAPPRGLRDGHNIVFYGSIEQLRERILYYLHPDRAAERLAVARRGWELAMGYHRSWHVMETVVFGKPYTKVGKITATAATGTITATDSTDDVAATAAVVPPNQQVVVAAAPAREESDSSISSSAIPPTPNQPVVEPAPVGVSHMNVNATTTTGVAVDVAVPLGETTTTTTKSPGPDSAAAAATTATTTATGQAAAATTTTSALGDAKTPPTGGPVQKHVAVTMSSGGGIESISVGAGAPAALPYYSIVDPADLAKFDPALHPIISRADVSPERPVRARLFNGALRKKLPTTKHILYDGMKKSGVIDLQSSEMMYKLDDVAHSVKAWSRDELWVIDFTHKDSIRLDCARIADMINQTHIHRRSIAEGAGAAPIVPLVVLAVDLDDTHNITHCPNVPPMVASLSSSMSSSSSAPPIVSYRLAKRSLAEHRCWSLKDAFATPGNLIPNANFGFGPTVHISFSVRSDTARSIAHMVRRQQQNNNDAVPMCPVDVPRPIDVSHYYTKAKVGNKRFYHDKLRIWVDAEIKNLNETQLFENDPTAPYIKSHAGTIGAAMQPGRKTVSESFVEHMLSTKIIVVSQRDSWEDHWRLFEALASGALVMHDLMLAPPRGLKDGENILFYTSIKQLHERILYYLHPSHAAERLLIARRGWELAMGYHRSWHTVETTILGRPYTKVGNAWADTPGAEGLAMAPNANAPPALGVPGAPSSSVDQSTATSAINTVPSGATTTVNATSGSGSVPESLSSSSSPEPAIPNESSSTNASGVSLLKYYSTDPGIIKFDASLNPVIRRNNDNNKPVKARLFTGALIKKLPTTKHIIFDGMVHSEMIDLQSHEMMYRLNDVTNSVKAWSDDELWVIDFTHKDSIRLDCSRIADMINQTHMHRGRISAATAKPAVPLVVLAVDLDDTPNVTHCPDVPGMVASLPGSSSSSSSPVVSYRLAKRSLTQRRCWSLKDAFVFHGNLIPNVDYDGSGPTVHMSFSVRSDTADSIVRIVKQDHGNNNNGAPLVSSPVDLVRPIDVSHYYTKAKVGNKRFYHDKLRIWVDAEINNLNETRLFENDPNAPVIHSHAGTIGAAMNPGRKTVSESFVRHMLSTKIIVVSQRDSWEDHWRLFEALASGALVMHDPMLAPPRGLRNDHNIIFYYSIEQLRERILYYLHPHHEKQRLAIARRGWELAMGYHRSWHVMETTIFGKPYTKVGNVSPWQPQQ